MFQPKALQLALAASAALVISAGARSDTGLNQGDSGATLPTRGKAPTPAPDPAPCEGDLNGDRRIDVLDLIDVILGWGTCPNEPDFGPYPVDDTDPSGLDDPQAGKDAPGPVLDKGGDPEADDDQLGQVMPCQGDINGDGYVDVQDLIEVLLNFGTSCP